MGALLNAAYNEEYGAETTDQSALNLIYLLGFQPSPGNFSIYGKSDERYHIVGGNPNCRSRSRTHSRPAAIIIGYRMTSIATERDGSITVSFDGQRP